MTWGEIQIESLKKMFLNKEDLLVAKLVDYLTDKKYRTYLCAMPQACNEALILIDSLIEPEIFTHSLTKNSNGLYDLSLLITNFKGIVDILCPQNVSWNMISSKLLKIQDWVSGDITILYRKKVDYITIETLSSKKLDLNEDYCKLIPLYIAGELYKDDDLSLATMYLNEFNNLLTLISKNNRTIKNTSISSIYRME